VPKEPAWGPGLHEHANISSRHTQHRLPLLNVIHTRAAAMRLLATKKAKGSSYSITERRVPELIPVLGSQPAGDMSHKPQKGPGSNRSRDAIG